MPPTAYPAVNALLAELLAGVSPILGEGFVGLYLYGSLAIGGFTPDRSDIDFLVVTAQSVSGAELAALQALHSRIAGSGRPLATELEGAYVSRDAIRRWDPAAAHVPHLDRGPGETLQLKHLDADWVIQRHVLRQHGIAVAGAPIRDLIDPIPPDDLRWAVRDILSTWWEPMLQNPGPLEHAGYRSYAALTMPRMLYTLERGAVVSKAVAAQLAQTTLPARWAALVTRALAFPRDACADTRDETLAFIRYTVERSR